MGHQMLHGLNIHREIVCSALHTIHLYDMEVIFKQFKNHHIHTSSSDKHNSKTT